MASKQNIINIREVIEVILTHKLTYVKVLVVAFGLACLWILPQPRYYNTKVVLAPETEDPTGGGNLSSLASSFGFNIGGMVSNDAIYPTLYPELMESPNFLSSLFDIKIETEDGSVKCDYYTYLDKHQKFSFWSYPKMWLQQLNNSLSSEKPEVAPKGKGVDVFCLTKRQSEIIEALKSNVKCTVDKKTDVITIAVTDQDRKVCALIADSVRVRLQKHITEYRTRKAKIDLQYYTDLAASSKAEYVKLRQKYAAMSDANQEVSLLSIKSKIEEVENEMQLKYNAYSAINTRLQAASAKVQERTPAFTVLHEASMPAKPAGPKRMIFVAGMLMLAFVGTTVYEMRKLRKARESKDNVSDSEEA